MQDKRNFNWTDKYAATTVHEFCFYHIPDLDR